MLQADFDDLCRDLAELAEFVTSSRRKQGLGEPDSDVDARTAALKVLGWLHPITRRPLFFRQTAPWAGALMELIRSHRGLNAFFVVNGDQVVFRSEVSDEEQERVRRHVFTIYDLPVFT